MKSVSIIFKIFLNYTAKLRKERQIKKETLENG